MITIRLRFAASRYHATPWGRHVNEGVTEWPPSPYRLVRALYDVWKRKSPHLNPESVESVLKSLASGTPAFSLPSATASHTRSYLNSNSEDPTDKSLVFDGFLAFQPEAVCYVHWRDLDLNPHELETLAELLRNLNYLGRSESWIEAAIDLEAADATWQCEPVGVASYAGEAAPVACVIAPADYKGKRPWLDALTASTTELTKSRVSGPPLLRFVRYVLPENAIDTDPASRPERRPAQVQAIMLGLDATVLPLAITTIEVAEQIRTRLMGAHRKLMKGDGSKVSSLFSGKDEAGEMRLDHGHLYILPQSNKAGRIYRILLLSRKHAINATEIEAVRGVRELYQADGRPPVRCVIGWQGKLDDEHVLHKSSSVGSSTPFVTARHWRKGRDLERFLQDEIRRECSNHGLPEPIGIKRLERMLGPFHNIEYRRNRKDDPSRPGYAFRLQFAEAVSTPFSLGYGSHFGLGQFIPLNGEQA